MIIEKKKDMFGNEISNDFEVKYEGPSFKEEFYDIDSLSKQLSAMDGLLKQSIKENKMNDIKLQRRVRIKGGSLTEIIALVAANPEIAITAKDAVAATFSALLAYYLKNKNETGKRLTNHENMVGLLNNRGDSITININGDNNNFNFYLSHKNKSEYLKNLEPRKDTNVKSTNFIGRFRKIDLNKKDEHRLGLDIRGVEKQNIPTKFSDSEYDIREVVLDVDQEITGRIEYENGEEKLIVVDDIKQTNRKLNFDNN